MVVIFVLGYMAIALEHPIKIDKAASALLTAVLTWTVFVLGAHAILHYDASLSIAENLETVTNLGFRTYLESLLYAAPEDIPKPNEMESHWIVHETRHHLGEISEILFFLLGAMTIVELVDAHEGFSVITDRITTKNKVKLLWIVSLITFFFSAVLDNLTTSIVMVSLLRKLIDNKQDRWFYAGIVVVAANAGGAFSPIGDVTTTMLWIGGQITASNIIVQLFIPSLICLLIPLIFLSFKMKGEVTRPELSAEDHKELVNPFEKQLIFGLGVALLLFVPVFKTVTHLPPYMGMLFGLGVLWVVTELLHKNKEYEEKKALSVLGVLRKIDTPSVLFFLGILLAISSLSSAGHLTLLAGTLKDSIGDVFGINIAIGLLSSIVDNVPLVAASMKMYPTMAQDALAALPLDQQEWFHHFIQDGTFWEFLAYCAGTGGSALIIGSAAGVAVMGMERIDFIWYLKNISLLALLGYFAGAFTYIGIALMFHL